MRALQAPIDPDNEQRAGLELYCRKKKVSIQVTKKKTPLTGPADDGMVLATKAGPALVDVAEIQHYSSPRYQDNPVNVVCRT